MTAEALIFGGARLLLLVLGGELLVRGASRVAAAVGLSPLIVGLTSSRSAPARRSWR